ncbi:MAG: ATP-binding protein [Sphaerochaetaceae bacterium]|nr:ATP-binding protein [Sphaerochaetaceae bacterium]
MKIKKAAIIILIIVLSAASCFGAKTVKAILAGTSSSSDSGGDFEGYTHDYIEKIAEFSGWDVQFIKLDDADMNESILKGMEMVRSGEADIMCGLSSNAATQKMFDFSSKDFIIVYTTLNSLASNFNVTDSSFANVDLLRVGVIKDAKTRNGEVEAFLAKEQVQYTLVPCENEDEQLALLEAGTVDVVSSISISPFQGTKVIAQFSPRPYFIAVTKGRTDLLSDIDMAITDIASAFPQFEEQLYDKNFSNKAGSFSLTESNKKTIAQIGSLDVLFVAETAPYSMIDDDGNPHGVLVSLIKDFAEKTGLKLNFYSFDAKSESFASMLDRCGIDCILGTPINNRYISKYNLITSLPVDSSEVVAYKKKNLSKPLSECTVALPTGSDLADSIQCKQFVYGASDRDCILMVDQGKADVGYGIRLTTAYYTYDTFASLITTPVVGMDKDICFALSRNLDKDLIAILNSYIADISNETLASLYAEANNQNEKNPMQLMARTRPWTLVLFSSAFIILVAGFLLFFILNNRRKKQNALLLEANSAKNEFLARMSHDMRTPINGILGTAKLMKDETDITQIQSDADAIINSSELLSGLINDTLDMSKIESRHLELHPSVCDPKILFDSAIDILRPEIFRKNLNLSVEGSSAMLKPVVADSSRLTQVLNNIIGNSIKFTPEGGSIAIQLHQLPSDSESEAFQFLIRDTGIGMSKEFQKHMFEPFSQENRINTDSDIGTGLGLSIVGQLVKLMNGTIEISSEIGKGTETIVSFRFPLASSAPAAKVHPDVSGLAGRKILIVEDNSLNAEIAKRILEKSKITAEIAVDGQKGLIAFASSKPSQFDAILMDVRMPVMDGLEATRQIRSLSRPDAASVPIIAMSANAYPEDKAKAAEAGMNAYLSKPIDIDLLYFTLGSCIPS